VGGYANLGGAFRGGLSKLLDGADATVCAGHGALRDSPCCAAEGGCYCGIAMRWEEGVNW